MSNTFLVLFICFQTRLFKNYLNTFWFHSGKWRLKHYFPFYITKRQKYCRIEHNLIKKNIYLLQAIYLYISLTTPIVSLKKMCKWKKRRYLRTTVHLYLFCFIISNFSAAWSSQEKPLLCSTLISCAVLCCTLLNFVLLYFFLFFFLFCLAVLSSIDLCSPLLCSVFLSSPPITYYSLNFFSSSYLDLELLSKDQCIQRCSPNITKVSNHCSVTDTVKLIDTIEKGSVLLQQNLTQHKFKMLVRFFSFSCWIWVSTVSFRK